MKTAIVILNYNTKNLLERFLPVVLKESELFADVIVADNASTDGSAQLITEKFPQVRLIANATNGGYAKGYNDCLKLVDAEYLLLLNSDVEVTPGWIEPLIKILDNNENIVSVQPKILSYKNKDYFEFAGAAGGFIDKYGFPFCRGRIFDSLEKDEMQYQQPGHIFWSSGACMLIRKKVFDEMNGFDEEFFAHMEEIDLCWRMHNAGYKVYFEPASVVYHIGGGTLASGNPRKTYLNFRNNLLMLHKNLPEKNFYSVFITKLILDGIAAVKFLFGDGRAHFMAVLNAHIYFYKNLNGRRLIRRTAQAKAKTIDLSGFYNKSIVWSYFVKREKRFSELDF